MVYGWLKSVRQVNTGVRVETGVRWETSVCGQGGGGVVEGVHGSLGIYVNEVV